MWLWIVAAYLLILVTVLRLIVRQANRGNYNHICPVCLEKCDFLVLGGICHSCAEEGKELHQKALP